MNNEVKEYVSRCDICLTYAPRQQKEPLLRHEVPDRPWAKVATDLFQLENKDYHLTVDYFSYFFEVDRLYSTTSETVIKKRKGHFARYGIPDEIISDNGSQFTAKEFRVFAQAYGFKYTHTSPHHHQSNGKAKSALLPRWLNEETLFPKKKRATHACNDKLSLEEVHEKHCIQLTKTPKNSYFVYANSLFGGRR